MFGRILRLAAVTAIAVVLIWRGSTFQGPEGTELITPVMCVVAGLFLFLTGVAMFLKVDGDMDQDLDETVVGHEEG